MKAQLSSRVSAETTTRTLANGVRLIVAELPRVPRVEVRLRWRWPADWVASLGPDASESSAGLATLTARCLLGEGRPGRPGRFSAGADLDRIAIGGGGLSDEREELVRTLADVAAAATEPTNDRFPMLRRRLVADLEFSTRRPQAIATATLTRRLFGSHPYARQLCAAELVERLTQHTVAAAARRLFEREPMVVVVAGDVEAEATVEHAARIFGELPPRTTEWTRAAFTKQPVAEVISTHDPRVRATVFAAARLCPGRSSAVYPALLAAQLMLGGYPGSGLVRSLRQENAIAYQPHCNFEHGHLASAISLGAEVRGGTAELARELIWSEVDRYADQDPKPDACSEVAATFARTFGMSVSTQAGIASTLAELDPFGLNLDWGFDLVDAVRRVDPSQIGDAWRRYIAGAEHWVRVEVLPDSHGTSSAP